MRLKISDVLAYLKAEGHAPAGADDAVRAALAAELDAEMPWHVRTAVGVGAWLATAFLLGSVFAIAGLRDDQARAIVGVLLIATAVAVRRQSSAEFLQQAAVATSLAGQALVIFGIAELLDSAVVAGITGTVLSIALLWLMPDRVHRFLSALIGSGSAIAAAVATEVPAAPEVTTLALVACTAYVWRVGIRDRDAAIAEMLEPVGYGLVVALFGVLLVDMATSMETFRGVTRELRTEMLGPATTIGITLAFMALVWKIMDEHGTSHGSGQSFAALVGVAALGAGALSSPGIVAGSAALVLAFDRRDRVLLGLAVIFLLVFGSAYYYSLGLTLLEKSGVLVGSGLLLIAIRQRIASSDRGNAP